MDDDPDLPSSESPSQLPTEELRVCGGIAVILATLNVTQPKAIR